MPTHFSCYLCKSANGHDPNHVLVQESTPTAEHTGTEIRESSPATEATPVAGKPGRFLLRLIDAGKGSSGIYPAATLKAAAEAGVFGQGLHLYADHPTASDAYERPERSVRDLAGVLAEKARWDEATQALVAEANVYAPFRPLFTEAADDIGVSIRALAVSEASNDGPIITEITEALSADFVTHAGRGGRILQVLESARAPVRETATDDERDSLTRALAPRAWLRDFDPAAGLVWFTEYSDVTDRSATWQQGYTLADGTATLTGSPVEVRPVTTYQPLTGTPDPSTAAEAATETTPASSAGANPQEHTMEITEADHAALTERANRADQLEAELARLNARQAAEQRAVTPLAEANLPDRLSRRALAEALRNLPLTEAGVLDEQAFDTRLTETIKAETDLLAEITPDRKVTGFGAAEATTTRTLAETVSAVPFTRTARKGA